MFGLLDGLADLLGVAEPALRLLCTILAAYPVALIHRKHFYGKSANEQHLFFILSGFILGFYNFGFDMFHTVANMMAVYLFLKLFGGTLISAVIVLAFNMTYLLIGYYLTATESYDIIWTMPHCILTLRLSGLAFDIYDGTQPKESLSRESKYSALSQVPSLLEVAAYTYFPTSFLVGPQFPMKRYQDYIDGKCKDASEELPDTIPTAVRRASLGLFYLIIFTVGSSYYTTEYLVSDEYEASSIFSRIHTCGIWAHIMFYKYISCWLLCEGSCILIGISYNGKDKDGKSRWDGLANVNVALFEGSQNFSRDSIQSFNINTNNWVMQYIYKRLKFLGNKYYSQLGVLLFLSLWHGLHSGYYVCFFMEFISVAAEKDFEVILTRNGKFLELLERPGFKQAKWVLCKYYTIMLMGPCLAPFVLLQAHRWWRFLKAIWFLPLIVWLLYPAYKPLLKKALPPRRERKD